MRYKRPLVRHLIMLGCHEKLLTKGTNAAQLSGETARSTPSLPPALMRQAIGRLRIVSLAAFFMMVLFWFVVNLVEGEIVDEFRSLQQWSPAVSILIASLTVYLLIRFSVLSPARLIAAGLVYEVIISYCIALAQYWDAFSEIEAWELNGDLVGSSFVGLWMFAFTVLVPSRPRSALIALLLAGSGVPVTMGVLIRVGNAPALSVGDFVSIFVFPYTIFVFFAYITARIIYGLGRDIRRAEQVGSYQLTERIGIGGMGEVWRARHELLARPAAVKMIRREVLRTGSIDEEMVLARFEQEAQVTAALQSPHTVELYDFGSAEDGTFYYVMELLEGVDLESLVKQFGAMPPERVLGVMQQACLSLSEAHRHGLLHRDIKPANIILCERAFEHDFVKVLDFGLVKQLSKLPNQEALTQAGLGGIAGTPAYMAPEIALNKPQVDGRADLYGLGCVAYWLLTGRRVFEEDGAVAMILAHVNKQPEPPSAHVDFVIPPALDALILSCLAKEPADRPESAHAMLQVMKSIDLPHRWTAERASQWWSTRGLG